MRITMFYDFTVRTQHPQDIPVAKKLGWHGVGIITAPKDYAALPPLTHKGIDIVQGIEIITNASALKKEVARLRKKVVLIGVRGGDLETNRKALETPEVDFLTHPWGTPEQPRNDPGINYIAAKKANEHNVAVCFEFTDLLHTYKKSRAHMFKNMLQAAQLLRKYRAPFLLTSGALSRWDFRAPSELMSFGKVLGFSDGAIKKALSPAIIQENKKRLGSRWIMPGVEIK